MPRNISPDPVLMTADRGDWTGGLRRAQQQSGYTFVMNWLAIWHTAIAELTDAAD
jgi:hypothetical protein